MRERIAVAATALVIGAATFMTGGTPPVPTGDGLAPPTPAPERPARARGPARPVDPGVVLPRRDATLRAFSSCGSLLEHVRTQASKLVGPDGLAGDGGFEPFGPVAVFGSGAAGEAPAAMPMAPSVDSGAGGDYSTTNVQVTGVDEPDIIKTDGRSIFWLGERTLRAVAVDPTGMAHAGSIRIPGGPERMLLAGDRMLVFSSGWGRVRGADLRPGARTRITTVDVSDPSAMRITATTDVEGTYVGARLVDGTARVVIRSGQPRDVTFTSPPSWTGPDVRAAIARNRKAITDAPLDSWLPRLSVGDDRGRTTRSVVGCSDVLAPTVFSGLDLVSVITFDPASPKDHRTASVLGSADTIYATADTMYVATSRVLTEGQREAFDGVWRTQIHAFDIRDASGARYRGSGEVAGTLKDQWAMDEHDGHLRVATTLGLPWSPASESMVTVLTERDGSLERVGSVGGMGEGEQIYAVRFMGARGYVVTFRQIDPLYTLDLSDPARPIVAGELKIPGYSAYLHPVGEDLLLGVGRAGTAAGAVLGTQVSLFDVSDPAKPARVDKLTYGSGSTEVEWDHHAFLHWPATGITLVPLHEYTVRNGEFTGAVGFRVAGRTLEPVARVSHQRDALEQRFIDVWRAGIRRSVVIGDRAYTVSPQGILASDATTLEERGWLAWGRGYHSVFSMTGRGAGFSDGWGDDARFRAPGQLAMGFGDVWLADTGNRAVRRISPWGDATTVGYRDANGDLVQRFPGETVGVAPGRARTLVATRCTLWSVRTDASDAALARVAGPAADCDDPARALGARDGSGASARFGSIGQIARAADGSYLVVDTGAHAVRRVVIAGGDATVTTVAGSLGEPGHADGPGPQARFSGPTGITVLPSGDVLIADTGNHVVRRLDPASWRVATIAGTPGRTAERARDNRLTAPRALAWDAVTERLFVTEGAGARGHRIRVIEDGIVRSIAGTGEAGSRGGSVREARFRGPSGLVVTGGNLFVADTGNHRIRVIR